MIQFAMFQIFGKRHHSYPPFVLPKTGEVVDDGQPKQIKLGAFSEQHLAESMAENIRGNVKPRTWRIWVEEVVNT